MQLMQQKRKKEFRIDNSGCSCYKRRFTTLNYTALSYATFLYKQVLSKTLKFSPFLFPPKYCCCDSGRYHSLFTELAKNFIETKMAEAEEVKSFPKKFALLFTEFP